MATTNVNEAGWFYHAPAKRQTDSGAVGYPPASQIPGLGEYVVESDIPERPHEMVFKESDTKYIRMAKQGGRKDLLCIRPNENLRQREPVPYPRNDWFYLEDNAAEDAVHKQDMNWQFLLPDYMVHEQHRSETVPQDNSKRPLFGYDKLSAFQREGETVTDKTVKLPELRRPGYGLRNSKPVKVVMKHPAQVVRSRPAVSQHTSAKPKSSQTAAFENSHAEMDKILSNKYQEEWQEAQRSHKLVACQGQVTHSEYKEAYSHAAKASAKASAKDSRKKSAPMSKSSVRPDAQAGLAEAAIFRDQKMPLPEKERFMLSRFKKVGPKLDTHMKPKTVTAAH